MIFRKTQKPGKVKLKRKVQMANWRLLKLETHNAYMNMAIDEAILQAKIKGLCPTPSIFTAGVLLRFHWKVPKLGKRGLHENCLKHGVDVVRRITGGGTVHHDAGGEITYSVVACKDDLDAGT
jgi:lipoate-protein ligase A